jgi:DNA-binding response OmpR family regulator
MKILLAEDDKNLGRLLQNLLKKENIKTDWVEDGEAAYEQCYRDGYDVLILDWMMPKFDGIALCKRLRAEEYQGKILLLTARDSVEDKVAGLNEGADDYLVKPFEMAELVGQAACLGAPSGQLQAGGLCL